MEVAEEINRAYTVCIPRAVQPAAHFVPRARRPYRRLISLSRAPPTRHLARPSSCPYPASLGLLPADVSSPRLLPSLCPSLPCQNSQSNHEQVTNITKDRERHMKTRTYLIQNSLKMAQHFPKYS